MRDSSLRDIHEMLLMKYVTMTHGGVPDRENRCTSDQQGRLDLVRHMASAYLPTGRVWQKVFTLEMEEREPSADAEAKAKILGEVFEMWRRKDGVDATLAWVGWLMRNGKGREAKEVIVRARSWLGDGERTEVEKGWTGILNEA